MKAYVIYVSGGLPKCGWTYTTLVDYGGARYFSTSRAARRYFEKLKAANNGLEYGLAEDCVFPLPIRPEGITAAQIEAIGSLEKKHGITLKNAVPLRRLKRGPVRAATAAEAERADEPLDIRAEFSSEEGPVSVVLNSGGDTVEGDIYAPLPRMDARVVLGC